jgi:hypothetical protein
MACGKCGGKRSGDGTASIYRPSLVGNDSDGTFTTLYSSEHDCSGPYSGPHESRLLYIVGRGTEQEQVFTRAERPTAQSEASRLGLSIDPIYARDLCHELVVATFAE